MEACLLPTIIWLLKAVPIYITLATPLPSCLCLPPTLCHYSEDTLSPTCLPTKYLASTIAAGNYI